MSEREAALAARPPRIERPSALSATVVIALAAFFVHGVVASDATVDRIFGGLGGVGDFVARAVPPDGSRLSSVAVAALETFEIAVVGTAIGAALSLPLAILASRNVSPSPIVYGVTRSLIAFLRSVPDLVWGLVFVVAVGLGPLAGIFAIAADTTGFCGRFYAERIEEVPPAPIEALEATGAPRPAVVLGAVLPATAPSLVATTMYALEGSTRSAVVLGLVGAGGIGVELSVSIELFRYNEALTIILAIFAIVLAVERTAAAIRRRLL